MSTTSPRMGIKIPDGSDPFLRTDFVQNWDTIDNYPGAYICTSVTRPSWTSAQAGMCIAETDTRRFLMWNGTSFHEMLTGPAVWWGSLRSGVQIGNRTSLTFIVGTFTVNRPGTIFGITTTEIGLPGNGYIDGNIRVLIDGANANFDGPFYGEYFESNWNNTGTTPALNQFGTTITSLGVRDVSPGTHTIGIQVDTSESTIGANTSARMTSCRALAMFVNGNDR